MIEKISKILFEEEAEKQAAPDTADVVAVKFMDVTEKDGKVLHIDTAVEGVISVEDAVTVTNEAGEDVAADDGDYEIPDLKKVITVKNGKVSAIKDSVEQSAQKVDEEHDETITVSNEVTELKEKISAIENKMNEFLDKFSKMNETVTKIANAPASEPVKTEKTGFSKYNEQKTEGLSLKAKNLLEIVKFRNQQI